MKFKIQELDIETYFKGYTIDGKRNETISYISSLSNADKDTLTFYSGDDPSKAANIQSKVLIVSNNLLGQFKAQSKSTIIFSDHPKFTFIKVISDHTDDSYSDKILAKIEHAEISRFAYVEEGVEFGKDVSFFPNTTIYNNTRLGNNCIVQSGSVLGGNGLGDVWHDGAFHRFVHLGGLIIGNNVTIGTNVSILRGMLENTTIGNGTKIGNNVNVGHSVEIGSNCYISSGVTLGGACVIKDNCWIAPGVTLNDHVTINENTKIGTGSVLIKDALSNSFYLGNPARKISERN